MKSIKNFFRQFFLINDTPNKVAAGAALGVFLGIAPGEGFLTTLAIASIFKLNRLAASAGVLATNLWSTFLVLPLAAYVGGILFGQSSNVLIEQFNNTYHLGWKYFLSKAILFDIALPLVVGFILVAAAIALIFYLLIFFLLTVRDLKFRTAKNDDC